MKLFLAFIFGLLFWPTLEAFERVTRGKKLYAWKVMGLYDDTVKGDEVEISKHFNETMSKVQDTYNNGELPFGLCIEMVGIKHIPGTFNALIVPHGHKGLL